MDISDPTTKAPMSLFVRGKALGKSVRVTPLPVVDDTLLSCAPVDHLGLYSADGSTLAVVEKDGVKVFSASTGAVLFSTPRPQVQAIALSPKGTYLLTWEKLVEGDAQGNLRLWRVATGEVACGWSQKVLGEKALWPAVHWSVDEQICYRLVTNEVHFFDGANPTREATHKLRVPDILQCSIEPTGAPHHVATFVPEKKGAPAVLRLWTYPDFGEVRASFSLPLAPRALRRTGYRLLAAAHRHKIALCSARLHSTRASLRAAPPLFCCRAASSPPSPFTRRSRSPFCGSRRAAPCWCTRTRRWTRRASRTWVRRGCTT